MVGSIRPTGVGAVSAVSGRAGGSSSRTGGALHKIAHRIAGRVAREFRLLEDDEQHSDERPPRDGNDIYDIREVARELASDLRARPTDEGRLARSLGSFAQESAALLAARPGAASLDTIARVIAKNDKPADGENADGAVSQIDQTVLGIVEARPE